MRKKPDLLDYLTERSSRAAVVGLILVLIGFLISDLPVMIQSQAWSTTKGEITYRQLSGIMFSEYDEDQHLEITGDLVSFDLPFRFRRLRRNETIHKLVTENHLSIDDLILPGGTLQHDFFPGRGQATFEMIVQVVGDI